MITISVNPFLVWMLVNLWLTHIILMKRDATISGWRGLYWLFVASIVTPAVLYFCGWMSDDEEDE